MSDFRQPPDFRDQNRKPELSEVMDLIIASELFTEQEAQLIAYFFRTNEEKRAELLGIYALAKQDDKMPVAALESLKSSLKENIKIYFEDFVTTMSFQPKELKIVNANLSKLMEDEGFMELLIHMYIVHKNEQPGSNVASTSESRVKRKIIDILKTYKLLK